MMNGVNPYRGNQEDLYYSFEFDEGGFSDDQTLGSPLQEQGSGSSSSSSSESCQGAFSGEISIAGSTFKLEQSPALCRKAYIRFLKELGVSPIFHFNLDGKGVEPDETYDDNPCRPMPFDLIPVLEHRKKLNRADAREIDVLINWMILNYLQDPSEEISFALYENEKKIRTERINIYELMTIYGYSLQPVENYEAYKSFPPNSEVYIRREDLKEQIIHSPAPKRSWEYDKRQMWSPPIDEGMQQIQYVQDRLELLLGRWVETQSPSAYDELNSYLQKVKREILPRCPQDKVPVLKEQLNFAFQVLFCE